MRGSGDQDPHDLHHHGGRANDAHVRLISSTEYHSHYTLMESIMVHDVVHTIMYIHTTL